MGCVSHIFRMSLDQSQEMEQSLDSDQGSVVDRALRPRVTLVNPGSDLIDSSPMSLHQVFPGHACSMCLL